MPATPMNEAALRYSPEMALAFQPTDTDRPATKKSCAVFDRFAAQKPIQMVVMTVRALKARIQGSMCIVWEGGKWERENLGAGVSVSRKPNFGIVLHLHEFSHDMVRSRRSAHLIGERI